MNYKKNILPDFANHKVGLILLSEWIGKESDLKKSTNASMDEVENADLPDGLISYSCLLSNDKNKVLHCVQWESQEHHLKYVENHLAERLEKLQGKIVVDSENSFGRFILKESRIDKHKFTPEFILLSHQSMELKGKPNHNSEYVLENIDTGKIMYYAELAGLDDGLISGNESCLYLLYRSVVSL